MENTGMRRVIAEAFQSLGNDIILAHAKELNVAGDAGQEAGGTDLLDYDCYLAELRQIDYDGPLIMHGLAENQVAQRVQFLKTKLSKACATAGAAPY